jgi:hypothetical protein
MVVRVHSHTLAGTTNTISVGVYPQSTSIDDPGLTFIDAGSFGGVTISQTTPVPALLTLPFQDYAQPYHPPMMRVVAKSTRTTTGTISGTVSIDISVKDS